MPTATVTSKGQVTIPKHVRERLGVHAGDEIEFVEEAEGFRIRRRIEASPFRRYRGFLRELEGSDPDALVAEIRGE